MEQKNINFIIFFILKYLTAVSSFDKFEQIQIFTQTVHLFYPSSLDVNIRLCWSDENLFKVEKRIKPLMPESVRTIGFDKILSGPRSFDRLSFNSMILMDLNCPETDKFLNTSLLQQFRLFKWFFINSNLKDDKINKLFGAVRRLNLGVGSEILYLAQTNDTNVIIYQSFKYSKTSDIITEQVGLWSSKKLIDLRTKSSIFRRRKDFNKNPLRAATVLLHPDTINHFDDYRDRHIDTMAKLNYHLTEHITKYLNATLNLTVTSTWGYKNKTTGQWSGMIGELHEDRADVAGTVLLPTVERLEAVDYVTSNTKTAGRIIFQSPNLSYTDDIFLLPFSRLVWICVVLVIPVIAAALLFVTYVERRTFKDTVRS